MRQQFFRISAALAVAAPLAAFSAFPSVAAPQMLGLVATNAPTPLLCVDGVCQAELSTFCLQEHRDMPQPGTAYETVDPAMISIVATTEDGREIRRPAGDLVRISVARAQFAVNLTIPQSVVQSMGGGKVAVEISELASVAPVPVAGDLDPLTEGEIKAAAGPLRSIAGHIATTGGPNAKAAVLTNRLINALAVEGERRLQLWERTFGREYALNSFDPGIKRAAEYYKICQTMPDKAEVRECLQAAHDGYMGRINIEYWKLVGGGS